MKEAASEVIDEQDGNHDTMVSVNGSGSGNCWRSHNGIMSAISVTTGKVLYVEVLGNY